MKTDNVEQRSRYEIQVELIEKSYKFHFNNIENIKRVMTETQKLYDQNDNTRVKQKCIIILKTAQKQLTELENKTPEVTRNYLIKKRELESLR